MIRILGLALGLMLVALATGCSDYVDDFRYWPRPAIAEIQPTTQPQPPNPPQPPPAVVLVSVVGVHTQSKDLGIPVSVEVRMRIENRGPHTVEFDPASLELINGYLVRFGRPKVTPPQPISLEPLQSAMVVAYFPLPAGGSLDDIDMNSLQLRWFLQLDGVSVGQGTEFRRVRTYYYDYGPYWGPGPYFWYGGVVVVHRR
jgi:hypothetical protein